MLDRSLFDGPCIYQCFFFHCMDFHHICFIASQFGNNLKILDGRLRIYYKG